jgi:hypothetical protein
MSSLYVFDSGFGQNPVLTAANIKGGKWMKELPNTIWELRAQPTKPTGQSPYFLVYGSDAIHCNRRGY